eukprot:6050543-Amphidinium_carterae.1
MSLVHLLTRASDTRGSDVRLDTGTLTRPRQWPRQAISVQQWHWELNTRWQWKVRSAITELELRAVLTAIKWRLRHGQVNCRFLHLVDNQAAGAVAVKG